MTGITTVEKELP